MNWNIFKRQNKTEEINRLKNENTSISIEKSKLDNEVIQLRNQHYSLNKEITGLKNEKKNLQSILEEQKKIINKNETIILEKTQKILKLETEVTNLKEELTNLKKLNQKEENIFNKYLKQETSPELTEKEIMEYLLTEENLENINKKENPHFKPNTGNTGFYRVTIMGKKYTYGRIKIKGNYIRDSSLYNLKKRVIYEGYSWVIKDKEKATVFIKNYLESTKENFKKESSQQTKSSSPPKKEEEEVNPHLKNLTPEEVDYLNTDENVIELTNKQKGSLKNNSIGFCWVSWDKLNNRYYYYAKNSERQLSSVSLIELKKKVIKKGFSWMKITPKLLEFNLEFYKVSITGNYYYFVCFLDKKYHILSYKDKGFVEYMREQIIKYYEETEIVQIYKKQKSKMEYPFKHELYGKKELEIKYQEYQEYKKQQEEKAYFNNLKLKIVRSRFGASELVNYTICTWDEEEIPLLETDNQQFAEYYTPLLEKEIREKQQLIIHTNKELKNIKHHYIKRDKRTVLTQYYNMLNKKHQFKWCIDKDNAVVCIDEEPTNVTAVRVSDFYNLCANKTDNTGSAYNYLQGVNSHLNHQVIYYIQELIRNKEYKDFYKQSLEVARV